MNALEIKDLSKSFGSFSLQNLTLTVPMGTALGLIGENGAGKSTTISLILGQLRRDSERSAFSGKTQTATTSPSARTSAQYSTRAAFRTG